MNKTMRKLWAVLLLAVLIGVMPAGGALAETAPENGVTAEEPAGAEEETLADGQENIEDEEVPLAEPRVNTVVFMWCGIAMVVVLASITGYASFGKTETVKR